jgi:3-hydroxybutyryl-CoA dehydrogenase
MAEIGKIAVIGTGTMGRGIVQWAAEGGATVLAFDEREGAAAGAKTFISDMLQRAVSRGRMAEADRDAALGRIVVAERMEDIADADLVVEAIIEDLDAKRDLFRRLDGIVGENTILVSNTSSLSVTACASACRDPGRVAGLHFFNPVPLMKVVEVISGERTRPEVIDALLAFVARTKHAPVVCSDTPGFIVNHAGRGLGTEGLRIIQEGVATFADVDRVMRQCAGFPMGPFELLDLTGLDVSAKVLREIYDAYFQDPRYKPTPLVYRRVEAGLFGRKVGEGFYRYQDGSKVEPPEAEVPQRVPARFFLEGGEEALAARLREGGLTPVDDAADADVVVLCPFGDDATTAALAGNYQPEKVVAVDALLPACLESGGRATLMATLVTPKETVDIVHAALAAAGLRVTRIADSPGFIAQRVLANIVNTACEIAQQRIATPQDIETGVSRGLGYPQGPLAIGDTIGPRRILDILERLQAITGDPRYRPSLWLRRRANLGLSLKTAE